MTTTTINTCKRQVTTRNQLTSNNRTCARKTQTFKHRTGTPIPPMPDSAPSHDTLTLHQGHINDATTTRERHDTVTTMHKPTSPREQSHVRVSHIVPYMLPSLCSSMVNELLAGCIVPLVSPSVTRTYSTSRSGSEPSTVTHSCTRISRSVQRSSGFLSSMRFKRLRRCGSQPLPQASHAGTNKV